MRRLNRCHRMPGGFALVEVLVALLLFSVAVAGALAAQLDALRATRMTLSQGRSARVLQDLVGRAAVDELAALAPAVLPLAADASALPAALGAWVTSASPAQAGPPAATLCVARSALLVELAIVFAASDGRPGGSCDDDGHRVTLLAVAP